MEMASFFETSVDVLLGYQAQDQSRERVLQMLKEHMHGRNGTVDFEEVEKGIWKYPNDFEIVYCSAALYAARGTLEQDDKWNERALTLFQRAVLLIDQNTDPKISLTSIQTGIAQVYRSLGRYQEAVELLKKNNPCGVNDGVIAVTLASKLRQPEEGIRYASVALLSSLMEQVDIAWAFLNAYAQQKEYRKMAEAAEWILRVIESIRLPGQACYLDKVKTSYQVSQGLAYLRLEDRERAREALLDARDTAIAFDSAPCYAANQIRFVSVEAATAYDDYGATALEGVRCLVEEQNDSEFLALWEEIEHEEKK